MIALSKLLKAGFLRTYLQEALAMMPPDCYIAVAQAETPSAKLLGACGALPPELQSGPFDLVAAATQQPDCICLPLQLDQEMAGYLLVGRSQANNSGLNGLEAAGRFLHHSLEEIMRREQVKRSLGVEALEQYREVALMQRAVVNLNSSMQLHDVMRALIDECAAAALPADYAMIYHKDGGLERWQRLYNSHAAADSTALVADPFTESDFDGLTQSRLFKEIVAGSKGEIINDLDADPRWEGEIHSISTLLVVPLCGSRMALGTIALAGLDPTQPFQAVHLKKIFTLASVAGIAMANAYHFEQVQQILLALIKAMATAIDARDRLTAGHSHRVAQLGLGLALVISEDQDLCPDVVFDKTEQLEIFYAGLLHDIGKIGVREEVLTKATRLPRAHLELIGLRLALWGELNELPWQDIYSHFENINKAYDLNKEDEAFIHQFTNESLHAAGRTMTILTPEEGQRLLTPRGNLTPDEWLEIRRHPEESFRILQNIPFATYFPNMLTMILQHHERLDGSGYPNAIAAQEIIHQSRIMAIVDVYDALRQDRHYKKALSHERAMHILKLEANDNHLDPRFVELFARHIDRIEHTLTTEIPFFPGRDV